MIEIQHVSKQYVPTIKAVDDVNFTVHNGEIFGFIGENGAGKSTTIHMISGILEPDSGDILLDGHSITKDPVAAKKTFGYVSDNPDFFMGMKAIRYLNLIADIYGVDQTTRKTNILSLAKTFELDELLNNPISSYSHGMRQKLMIIAALLHEPNNWILDEPLVGLDPKSQHDTKAMMKDHAAKGHSVFFSTHALEVAEKLCDRIGVIHHGKLLFVGTLDQLRSQYDATMSLEDLFLEMTSNA